MGRENGLHPSAVLPPSGLRVPCGKQRFSLKNRRSTSDGDISTEVLRSTDQRRILERMAAKGIATWKMKRSRYFQTETWNLQQPSSLYRSQEKNFRIIQSMAQLESAHDSNQHFFHFSWIKKMHSLANKQVILIHLFLTLDTRP